MPPDAPAVIERPAILRVGNWVVYPRLCRATRSGTPIHLRSQVIDLLVVLARRPNAMVPKDEVMAALWPGVHVSNSALSRCMAELRQVFEDDAKNPWLVETIAKRGYRLIAPVTIEEQDPALQAAASSPEGVAAAPDGDLRVQSSAAPAASCVRRIDTRWWAAAVVVVLAAAAAVGWTFWRSRQPVVALSGADTLVLADVVNTTGDQSFDGAVRLALAMQLEQAPQFRIISDERVRETLTLMKKPPAEPVTGAVALEVCRREGAAVLLAGSVSRLGKRFAVGLEAIGCRQGDSLARVIEEADSADGVLQAVGRVASSVRARLGETRASLKASDVPVARATTASLDALRALSLGDAKRRDGRILDALGHYQQATAIDPQFAVAWARQGTVLGGIGRPAEATAALTRAFGAAGRTTLPERYYITAHYHLQVTGQIDQAVEALRSWRDLYPGSAAAAALLAAVYSLDLGEYQEALDLLRRAESQVPSDATTVWLRANSLVALGRLEEARKVLDDWRLKADLDGPAASLRTTVAWAMGDREALTLESKRAAIAGQELAFWMDERLGEIAFAEGRVNEGRRLYGEAIGLQVKAGAMAEAARSRLRLAQALATLGESAVARRETEAALAAQKDRDTWLRAAMVFALAGARVEARRALEAGVAAAPFAATADAVWIPTVKAAVEGIDRPDAGLSDLDSVASCRTGLAFRLIPLGLRAHLLERAGRPADVVETCRDFIKWRGVNLSSPQLPVVRVMLARALARTGDRKGSRDAYDAFFASWKTADADAALLRAARSEYAALREP